MRQNSKNDSNIYYSPKNPQSFTKSYINTENSGEIYPVISPLKKKSDIMQHSQINESKNYPQRELQSRATNNQSEVPYVEIQQRVHHSYDQFSQDREFLEGDFDDSVTFARKKSPSFKVGINTFREEDTVRSYSQTNQLQENYFQQKFFINSFEFGTRDIKWNSEWLRVLMIYLEIDYVEWNPDSRQEWLERKETLIKRFEKAELPYILHIHNDQETLVNGLFQLAKYACSQRQRFDLVGKSQEECKKIEEIENILEKFSNILYETCTMKVEELRANWKGLALEKINKISRIIEDEICGMNFFFDQLTIIDFVLYYCFDFLEAITVSLNVDNPFVLFPKITRVIIEFSALKQINSYIGSKEFIHRKWTNPLLPIMEN